VSLSADPERRDFTLGQEERDLEIRVRTPHNGPNGLRTTAWTQDAPVDGSPMDVVATSDGRRAQVYVDGRCAGDAVLTLPRAPQALGELAAPALLAAVVFPALALAWLASSAAVRRVLVWLCGAVTFALLRWAGVWEHLPDFDAPALLVAGAGLWAAAHLACAQDAGDPPPGASAIRDPGHGPAPPSDQSSPLGGIG
jgi:hypothetical protein